MTWKWMVNHLDLSLQFNGLQLASQELANRKASDGLLANNRTFYL